MRVLEQCTSSTQLEIQQQINALREAFSRDTSKPFELKHTLGMHSPVMDQHAVTNGITTQSMQQPAVMQSAVGQGWPLPHNDVSPKTTNPTSDYMQSFDATTASASMPGANPVAFNTNSFDLPSSTAYPTQNFSHVATTAYQQPYSLERVSSNEQSTTPVWDPSGIFSQWNTAFGPQPNPQQPSPPTAQYTPVSSASMMRQTMPQQPVSAGMAASFYQPPAVAAVRQQQQTPIQSGPFPGMPTVTPNMWQDAFTSAYVSGHGQKRFRDDTGDLNGVYDPYGGKRRG